MTAVLLESRSEGVSAWTAVRRQKCVRIQGMEEGDILEIHFWNSTATVEIVKENKTIPIPEHTRRVKVYHVECSGAKVSVDLI